MIELRSKNSTIQLSKGAPGRYLVANSEHRYSSKISFSANHTVLWEKITDTLHVTAI